MEERKIGMRENGKTGKGWERVVDCLNHGLGGLHGLHGLQDLCRARVGVGAGRTEFCADRGQDRE